MNDNVSHFFDVLPGGAECLVNFYPRNFTTTFVGFDNNIKEDPKSILHFQCHVSLKPDYMRHMLPQI